MKKIVIKILIISFIVFGLINFIHAIDLLLKLPYQKGEKFIVTRGYDTYPTHKPEGVDRYALDFTQDGCRAYGKPVLVVASGVVKNLLREDSKNKRKSYGNAVRIDHGNNLESIYAHLEKFSVDRDQEVKQGQLIGYVGNTGNVEGQACPEHPGTHLHFAMYQRQPNGKLTAYKPEPMSGYTNFLAGNWYVSDNDIFPTKFVEEKPPLSPIPTSIPTQPTQTEPPKNFWQILGSLLESVGNFFYNTLQNLTGSVGNLVETENKELETAEVEKGKLEMTNQESGTKNEELVYHAKLIEKNPNQNLILKENEVIALLVRFKNTGTTVWKKENVSLNVASEEAKKFYHSSWLTRKRPARLTETEVKPNNIGSFNFLITASNLEPKNYNSSFRPVYQDSIGFHWLGAEIVSWQITFEKQEQKIVLNQPMPLSSINQIQKPANESVLYETINIQLEKEQEPILTLGSGGGNSVGNGGNDGNDGGNGSGDSTSPPLDNVPPEITLTSYPSNLTNSQKATFEFSANEEVVFKCKLNEGEKEDCSSPKNYENLTAGEHYFFLEAFDSKENQSSLVYLWQIDLTRPTSQIITSGIFNNQNLPQFIEGTFKEENIEKVEISLQKESDGKFLAKNDEEFIWQEEQLWLETTVDFENKTWRFEIPKDVFTDDFYKIYSQAKDKAGNLEELIQETSFIFDATPPEKPKDPAFQKEELNLIFSWPKVVDNLSGLDFYELAWWIEGGEENFVQTKKLTFTLENIDEEKFYYFKVRAVDLAKNYGEWSKEVFYQPAPYLENWQKRKVVMIDNQKNNSQLTDFEINLVINYQPEMNNDFSDIRFTDEDGQTLLNYGWEINDQGLEKKENGVLAEAVVKIPSIPAKGKKKIYLYYGNLRARSVANLEKTLTWFDHFNTSSSEKYDYNDVAWQTNFSRVRISLRSLGFLSPKNLEIKNFWLRTRIAREGSGEIQIFWRRKDKDNTWLARITRNGSFWEVYEKGLRQEQSRASFSWDASYIPIEIKTNESKHSLKIDKFFSNEVNNEKINEKGKIMFFESWTLPWWYTWWGDWGPNCTYLDYLYIRQYVQLMPTVSFLE